MRSASAGLRYGCVGASTSSKTSRASRAYRRSSGRRAVYTSAPKVLLRHLAPVAGPAGVAALNDLVHRALAVHPRQREGLARRLIMLGVDTGHHVRMKLRQPTIVATRGRAVVVEAILPDAPQAPPHAV